MKVKSSLVVPVLAASILGPTMGSAMVAHNSGISNTTSSVQKEDHHKWGIGEKQNNLMNIINQYASPQLKDKLTKDLATREELIKQLKQTPGFLKKVEQEKTQRQALYQAHKQEIDNIKQQVKDGKLTRQQAHKHFKAIFGKTENGVKEQGQRAIFQELKAAIQKKDQNAINSALEKFDQNLVSSNQQLQQKINAYK